MVKEAYILLPGIRTDPSDWRNWAPRMATEINVRLPDAKGDEFRYYAPAITPKGKQETRTEFVKELARQYQAAGYSVNIIAHSNGAIIATETLRETTLRIDKLFLFAPACHESFDRNGLNDALLAGQVNQVKVYTGSRDFVLKYIAWAGSFLGYGRLGYVGPQEVSMDVAGKVFTKYTDFDHCQWFEGDQFNKTFQLIFPYAA